MSDNELSVDIQSLTNKNWKLKEEEKNLKGQRLEIELPSEVQEIPF